MLVNGDCLEEIQKLVDKCIQVDQIITDPPYHLTSIVERFGKEGSAPAKDKDGAFQRQSVGFMGKEWDGGDIAFRKETWELFMKVLKPGGHLLAFSGSRTYHRMAVAIEDAGFSIRDQIMWLYGSGFPKSLNLGDGWGTALKPAHEPIVLARKKIEGTNKQNRKKYGTGGIHIDACRIEGEKQTRDSNPVMNGGKYGQNQNAERKIVKRKSRSDDCVWTNKNSGMKAEGTHYADADPKARFPANVMHDGSEEVQDIFPQTRKSVPTKRTRKTLGMFGMPNDATPEYDDEGTAARYFYCPKTSKSEKGNDNTHPTVKPLKLMKYLCRLVTPKGGTVLDPFMGSGSTGVAAKDEGFEFIGIEKEKEYFEIAERRISVASTLEEFMK